MKPKDIDDAEFIFPGSVRELLPARGDLPDEYQNGWHRKSNAACNVVSTWFYKGLEGAEWTPRDGIDTDGALRHIGTCLGSWDPKHEHKIGGCGYLMALWFKKVKVNGETHKFDEPEPIKQAA